MFQAAGEEEPKVLCTHISANKTTDGVVRCIGALPQVDQLLRPVEVISEELFFSCHRPGADSSRPPVDCYHLFAHESEALIAAGEKPAHFRGAFVNVGVRAWQLFLVVTASNGDYVRAMSYRYHDDRLSKVPLGQGVPDWAVKTHLGHRTAAQMGTGRDAVESDIREHGLWSLMICAGTNEAAIPNPDVTNAMSRRPASCSSHCTPRLSVAVPQASQGTV